MMNIEHLAAIADRKIQIKSAEMKDFQLNELDHFKANGLKETILDSYKFTNLESFFSKISVEESQKSIETIDYSKSKMPAIIFKDGEYSDSHAIPKGMTIKRIKDHLEELKKILQNGNALSSLHHGLFNDGVIIEIQKNEVIKHPVRILNIMTKSSIFAPLHVVIANNFSKVTILEETIFNNMPLANISETYLIAHQNALIEHIQIERENDQGLNHGTVFAEVAKDASIKSFFFNGTGKLNRKNLILNLTAPGSNGETYSLFLTDGLEHSDINTVINHLAPDTTSKQMAKGILDGESKGIFTGKIHIHPKAQRVSSAQLNKNLLLSRKAQIHSQPQLEIFADDVKCSHGSTTGQLSDEEVFYFQARGIPADRARSILAHGFGLEIVQKISNQDARDHIEAIIMANLQTKFKIGSIK